MSFLHPSVWLSRAIALIATYMAYAAFLILPSSAWAQAKASGVMPGEVTLQMQYWVDEGGQTRIEQLSQAAHDPFTPMDKHRSFALNQTSALWMRLDLPARDMRERWYLQLSSGTFIDKVSLFQRDAAGAWKEQVAGDHVPVGKWTNPDQTPVFSLDLLKPSTVWLRLENQPASIAPRLQWISEDTLYKQRYWSFLLLGSYFGFGLLVLFLGVVHARLYGDRAFVAYSAYVAFMLAFQVAFTGIGGMFFWPEWAKWNNAVPAIFMLLLTSTGIWFVREASTLARHSKLLDKTVMAWVVFGVVFSAIYTLFTNHPAFIVLNLYGLLSVLLSIFLCLWVWRKGERYGGWLFLGFLPVHLGYPFPALRSAGVITDNWLSQYAVLIGSAIEIPLLLYILHRRAKEFSENRARVRVIDQIDPLTGLTIAPVLTLRVRDALRRSKRQKQFFALMLVELANHTEIVKADGRAAGDRALVVAASRILSTVDELDTVCRIDDARFAVLVEGPMTRVKVGALAQHIVAHGLAGETALHSEKSLRFRVVTSMLPQTSYEQDYSDGINLQDLLDPLVNFMNQLATEQKKLIWHLS